MKEDQSVSLSVVLQAISDEISRLADIMEPVEVALDSSLAYDEVGRGFRQVFQSFDLHSQSVKTLARMLQAMAEKIPIDIQIDPLAAIADVHLEQIRSRLESSCQSVAGCGQTGASQATNSRDRSCAPVETVQNIELF